VIGRQWIEWQNNFDFFDGNPGREGARKGVKKTSPSFMVIGMYCCLSQSFSNGNVVVVLAPRGLFMVVALFVFCYFSFVIHDFYRLQTAKGNLAKEAMLPTEPSSFLPQRPW